MIVSAMRGDNRNGTLRTQASAHTAASHAREKTQGGDVVRPRPLFRVRSSRRASSDATVPDYWTVIVPFIPIARCGVQWYGYDPGLTFANEMV